jgi:hypothetical protein
MYDRKFPRNGFIWHYEVIGFFNWPNPSSRTMALGYQESSWGKGQPARVADDLTAICEPIV